MHSYDEQIKALDDAIAEGAVKLRRGDEEIQYGTVAEMQKARAHLQTLRDGQAAHIRVSTPRMGRGL